MRRGWGWIVVRRNLYSQEQATDFVLREQDHWYSLHNRTRKDGPFKVYQSKIFK